MDRVDRAVRGHDHERPGSRARRSGGPGPRRRRSGSGSGPRRRSRRPTRGSRPRSRRRPRCRARRPCPIRRAARRRRSARAAGTRRAGTRSPRSRSRRCGRAASDRRTGAPARSGMLEIGSRRVRRRPADASRSAPQAASASARQQRRAGARARGGSSRGSLQRALRGGDPVAHEGEAAVQIREAIRDEQEAHADQDRRPEAISSARKCRLTRCEALEEDARCSSPRAGTAPRAPRSRPCSRPDAVEHGLALPGQRQDRREDRPDAGRPAEREARADQRTSSRSCAGPCGTGSACRDTARGSG